MGAEFLVPESGITQGRSRAIGAGILVMRKPRLSESGTLANVTAGGLPLQCRPGRGSYECEQLSSTVTGSSRPSFGKNGEKNNQSLQPVLAALVGTSAGQSFENSDRSTCVGHVKTGEVRVFRRPFHQRSPRNVGQSPGVMKSTLGFMSALSSVTSALAIGMASQSTSTDTPLFALI